MTTEQRLERLEREVRRAKRWSHGLLVGLGVCLGAAVFGGWVWEPTMIAAQSSASVANEVHAKKFVLEDSKGEMRGMLGLVAGNPTLLMLDEKAEPRIGMYVKRDGPKMDLGADGGGVRLSLSVRNKGEPTLTMLDGRALVRARLNLGKQGPRLDLYDEMGEQRLGLALSKGPDPMGTVPLLAMHNRRGITSSSLMVVRNDPRLDLFDEKGDARVTLTVDKGPSLYMWGTQGTGVKKRAQLHVRKDGAGLRFLDKNGDPVWSAP